MIGQVPVISGEGDPASRIRHRVSLVYSRPGVLFAARYLDETHALREQLSTVAVPPGAHAVGRTLAELQLANAEVMVNAIRRDGITGHEPLPDTELRAGDVVVLFGTPEALERDKSILLNG